MAGEKKKARSDKSWEDAVKKAVKDLPAGTYPVVLHVAVTVQSPGIVHEYIVEVG